MMAARPVNLIPSKPLAARTVLVGTSRERIFSRRKKNLNSGAELTTTKGKTTVEFGGSIAREDGKTTYKNTAKATATAYEQTVKKSFTPFSKQVVGLERGSQKRKAVMALQKSLNKEGATLVVDGGFGPATVSALQNFQRSKGLTATGRVDEATAKALPTVGLTGLGGSAEAGYKVGSAEANASFERIESADQLSIKGAAGAKAVLVGGNAKIDLPVFGWTIGGEELQVGVTVGVNADVLAEAKGDIELNLEKGDALNLEVKTGGEVFAGAKAGVEVGSDLRWMRKESAQYVPDLKTMVGNMPGFLARRIVNQLPDGVWTSVAKLLIGAGKTQLLYGGVGIEGSAGIGAKGSLGAKLRVGPLRSVRLLVPHLGSVGPPKPSFACMRLTVLASLA